MSAGDTPPDFLTGGRRHRRIAYRVTFGEPSRHRRPPDMMEGLYRDREGDVLGRILVQEDPPEGFLVLPLEEIPLVHVEAQLEGDKRLSGYEQVFALLYEPSEEPAAGVAENGERWESGDLVVYAFETDDEALEAQS